jgi:hypothetical protein
MKWSDHTQTGISKTLQRPADCPAEDDKKVVVCKYVGTPPGTPHHIIVVSVSSIKDFPGTFPWTFADEQDSVAIRYAVGNEQPGNEELVHCPGYQPPPTDVCTKLPGNQPTGTACTKADEVVTTSTEGAADCEADTVPITTTVTTTPYVFNAETNTWSPGTPNAVVTHSTRPATKTECPDVPQVNPTVVTPNAPSQTAPTCTTAGSIVEPAAQAGVNVVRTDLGNGSVRFDSTPAANYVFVGAQTVSATVTALPMLSGASCGEVEGTDESTDEPPATVNTPEANTPEVQGVSGTRTPTVKGVSGSAPVPSAVEAGLAGQQTDVRVLVGQALLGAGLLLFVASTWAGLGTRRRGVQQA